MLNVYSADWCPHCQDTVRFLRENNIDFNYIDIETQPEHIVKKVIQANGGGEWVVPTLEYNGKWREGKMFDAAGLLEDLKILTVIP